LRSEKCEEVGIYEEELSSFVLFPQVSSSFRVALTGSTSDKDFWSIYIPFLVVTHIPQVRDRRIAILQYPRWKNIGFRETDTIPS
jgi:hypothetical protein